MRRLVIAFLVIVAPFANACTTFCTRGLFGRNYDFEIGYGAVTINKRGMTKSSRTDAPVQWVSKHGSLTFNQYGRENPTGGMNEAGLVVELMWLDGSQYPPADHRPTLGVLEWIQYQLDNSATVADVVRNAGAVRIASRIPLHYLVADAKGDVAAIEFLGGKLVVHRGESLPVAALANDPYGDSLAAMKRGANDRFARAANGLASAATIDGAFALLENVKQTHTQWSIVYDIPKRTVHWRTKSNPERRSVSFAKFDFRCNTPVRILDVDAGGGDVAARFRDYTTAANRALVARSTSGTSFLRGTPESEIDDAAWWPERSACR